MKRLPPLSANLAFACAFAGIAAEAAAGPEKIAFPAGFRDGVMYATVDRHDNKQFRELYTSRAAVEAARAGKPLPDGTVITLLIHKAKLDDQGNPVKDANGRFVKGELTGYTVMEKRAGWGAEYAEDLRNGDWEYAVFKADGQFNDKANYKSCFECHKPHAGQDYVISMARMAGTFPDAAAKLPSGPADVGISGFAFGPGALSVKAGTAVTWTNGDDSPHQIAVKDSGQKTGVLLKGQSGTLKFDQPGSHPYICGLHPAMKGTVEVAP